MIEVEDKGDGIPDEIVEQIYDPFFTTKAKGTGLGLAISSMIISQHSGSLSFRKNPHAELRFASSYLHGRRAHMANDAILIVDDDSSVRRVLQMQLSEAGYRVELAATGAEAHRILVERRPKLLITDLRMPDLDGIELLRLISQEEIETTVIMITAFGSIETAVQAMRLGAYDYITKPIDYEALLLGREPGHGAPESDR